MGGGCMKLKHPEAWDLSPTAVQTWSEWNRENKDWRLQEEDINKHTTTAKTQEDHTHTQHHVTKSDHICN